MVLLGHIQNIRENQISLVPDLKENLAIADKVETNLIKKVDQYIEKIGLDAPVETLPELHDGYEADLILDLDLKSNGISDVIWATGYKCGFSLVKLPTVDEHGYPLHTRGVTEFPGLYFIGLPFLHTRKSGLLAGVGADAAYVAQHISSH